jgi:multidrug transporter EmrE-like cation transporter
MNLIFKTIASGKIPAIQMYPLLRGASLICSAIMAAIFMKETPNKKSIISILIALIAVIFMTL